MNALCPIVVPVSVLVLSANAALIFLRTVKRCATLHICVGDVRKG